jgi:hydroxymethylglutaryl-CoA reductase
VSGFYKKSIEERIRFVQDFANLTEEEVELLTKTGGLPAELADRMIENVVGVFPVPLGIGINFLINGRDYLIPMAIEEPSVVAAASNAAKMVRGGGGFHTSSTAPVMIGQIQAVDVQNPHHARMAIYAHKNELLTKANEQDPVLVSLGGGAKDLQARVITTPTGSMLITEIYVDCRDIMGANAVNTMVEAVAPIVERVTGGRVLLRIISNLATRRLARAYATIPKEAVGGEEVVEGIVHAYHFASADPFRAATHNKGILNGAIAVVLATCNDHRAIEAGAHAYAAHTGHYTSLSVWEKNQDGDLMGSLEMPMAVGTVGGAVRTHPIAKVALKILGVKSANELAEVIVAVGLAQNLAALRALAHEGIQKGHMRLHARNVAIAAGATGKLIDAIGEQMIKEETIRLDRAAALLERARKSSEC